MGLGQGLKQTCSCTQLACTLQSLQEEPLGATPPTSSQPPVPERLAGQVLELHLPDCSLWREVLSEKCNDVMSGMCSWTASAQGLAPLCAACCLCLDAPRCKCAIDSAHRWPCAAGSCCHLRQSCAVNGAKRCVQCAAMCADLQPRDGGCRAGHCRQG